MCRLYWPFVFCPTFRQRKLAFARRNRLYITFRQSRNGHFFTWPYFKRAIFTSLILLPIIHAYIGISNPNFSRITFPSFARISKWQRRQNSNDIVQLSWKLKVMDEIPITAGGKEHFANRLYRDCFQLSKIETQRRGSPHRSSCIAISSPTEL